MSYSIDKVLSLCEEAKFNGDKYATNKKGHSLSGSTTGPPMLLCTTFISPLAFSMTFVSITALRATRTTGMINRLVVSGADFFRIRTTTLIPGQSLLSTLYLEDWSSSGHLQPDVLAADSSSTVLRFLNWSLEQTPMCSVYE